MCRWKHISSDGQKKRRCDQGRRQRTWLNLLSNPQEIIVNL